MTQFEWRFQNKTLNFLFYLNRLSQSGDNIKAIFFFRKYGIVAFLTARALKKSRAQLVKTINLLTCQFEMLRTLYEISKLN